MKGNERTGVLLLVMIILVMEHWEYNELPEKAEKATKKQKKQRAEPPMKTQASGLTAADPGYLEFALNSVRASHYVKAIFHLVIYEAFLRKDEIPMECIPSVKKFIPLMLDGVFNAFPRSEGAGNNLIKNHLPMHLTRDIERLGTPRNTDSGPGEHLHIDSIKKPARRTNWNKDTFIHQTAKNYIDNLVARRSHIDSAIFVHDANQTSNSEDDIEVAYRGEFATIGIDYIRSYRRKKTSLIPDWGDSAVSSEEVIGVIRDLIIPNMTGDMAEVKLYSSTKRNNEIFYAHPYYGKKRQPKQDWVMATFTTGDIPAHLLCFMHLETDLKKTVKVGGCEIKNKGHYAFIHTADSKLTETGVTKDGRQDMGNLAHIDQKLMHRTRKQMSNHDSDQPLLMAIDCETIAGPLVGFKDIHSKIDHYYYFLKPHHQWADIFIQCAKEHRKD